MAIVQGAITIGLFILILGGLVLIHEVGHFALARFFRIRVLEFGIGFPPRARTLRQRGETLYTLNWLPIGGFVRLEGEDGDSDDVHSFAVQRLWKKLVVLVAGVGMNLLLAFVIFFSIAWLATPQGGLSFAEVTAGSSLPRSSCSFLMKMSTYSMRACTSGIVPKSISQTGNVVSRSLPQKLT